MATAAVNAAFRALIVTVKNETGCKEVKNAVKGEYRVWNAASSAVADAFHTAFEPAYADVLARGFEAVPKHAALLAGKTVAEVFGSLPDQSRATACLLAVFALSITAHATPDPDLKALARVQAALGDPDVAVDDVILDDELAAFVRDVAAKLKAADVQIAFASPVPALGAESSIMAIARDISAGVDPNVLSRPDGMQALVQSVSAGIGERIQSGQVDPAALMQEATAMLQNIDISEALKLIGGQGGMDMSAFAGMDMSALAGMLQQPQPQTPKSKSSKKK